MSREAVASPSSGPAPQGPEVAELSRVRARTLALVDGAAQEELDRRPGRGRWSAGEVVDHLLLSDRIYRRDLEELFRRARRGEGRVLSRSFADLNASVLFVPKPILPLLEPPLAVLGSILPQPVRDVLARSRWLPAQNPDDAEPRIGRPREALRRELVHSLETTLDLLRRNRDLDWGRLEHRHPLLGRHDVPGLLRFIAGHEERHREQLAETLDAVRRSSGASADRSADHPSHRSRSGDRSRTRRCPCASS